MKPFRIVLWLAVLVLAAWLGYATFLRPRVEQKRAASSFGIADIGGPFSAVTATGREITQQGLKGRPHVMFFGFTHCPDVCPTTLYEASQWLARLGDKADALDVYFVTVDPKRDTQEVLRDYVSAFDPRIQAITGSEEQIAGMVSAWRVFARKVALEGAADMSDSYTMDHTATTFLMNADGTFSGTIAYGENSDVAVQKLKRLFDKNS